MLPHDAPRQQQSPLTEVAEVAWPGWMSIILACLSSTTTASLGVGLVGHAQVGTKGKLCAGGDGGGGE
jgi:hypothetical protein